MGGYWEINKLTQEEIKTLQTLIDEDIKRELRIKKEFREKNK
jgi:Ser/Thr protein kinase RdoA (MazF antagonist)